MRAMRNLLWGAVAVVAAGLNCQLAGASPTERIAGGAFTERKFPNAGSAVDAVGRFIAFVAEESTGKAVVFLRDRLDAESIPVSVSRFGARAHLTSVEPSISADGHSVAFTTASDNLVAGDTNNRRDVFVRDWSERRTERVSLNVAGAQNADASYDPSISADGRFVAFVTERPRPGFPGEFLTDVFVHNRRTGTTLQVSDNDGENSSPSISGNGQIVAWACKDDPDAADTHVCIRNLQSATTQTGPVGENPSISADGRVVAFTSLGELVAGDDNGVSDVYAFLVGSGQIQRISVSSAGGDADGASFDASVSANGRLVAFASEASNLVAGDTNGDSDIFVHDRATRLTERTSVDSSGDQASGDSSSPSISGDGGFVSFDSLAADLVKGDANAVADVFLRDRNYRADLLVDFGTRGLWRFVDNRNWIKIDGASPVALVTRDRDALFIDEVIGSFPGLGLLSRSVKPGPWLLRLHHLVPNHIVAADLDGSGIDDLAADFPNRGLQVMRDNFSFASTSKGSTGGLATGDLDGDGKDDLVADLGRDGLWARFGDNWVKLQGGSPVRIATGDLDGSGEDDLVADLGNSGLFVRYNNVPPFVRKRGGRTEGLATGDLDGSGEDDLVVDLGGAGLWVLYNNQGPLVKLDSRSPTSILAADLNGSGKDDLVVDFGSEGLFARYDNSGAFKLLRAWPSQAVVAGSFD